MTNNKIVLVDFGIYMFTAIFASVKMSIYPTYLAMTMILGDLRKIGLNEDDTVIIAVDSPKGSWRKDVDSQYKAGRREAREKLAIDWGKMFTDFHSLLEQLEASTPFHIIVIDKLEADDIIAYSVKRFKDNDCIILSSDTDYEQLYAYPNVKVFSNKSKRYKIVKNPYLVLSKKIDKETTDGLTNEVMNELDYEKRNSLVNLISLPTEIENKVESEISFLPKKEWDYNNLPFKSLSERFKSIYKQDKVVSVDKKPKKKRKKKEKQEV